MFLTSTEVAVLGTLIGTLGAAFIGGLVTIVVTYINKRSEERRYFREVVIKATLEEWKHISEISSSPGIFPLANYIINAAKMCELALDKKVTPQNIRKKLEAIYSLADIVDESTLARARKAVQRPLNSQ